MEERKTHWREISKSDYIGVEALYNGKDIEVIIKEIKLYDSIKIQGKSQKAAIAYFHENKYFDKPMVINPTNGRRLEKLSGSEYIEDIKNFPVRLTKEPCKSHEGGMTVGLRISKIPAKIKYEPQKKETLVIASENFEKCRKALKSGYTIDQMREKYDISIEVEKELLK